MKRKLTFTKVTNARKQFPKGLCSFIDIGYDVASRWPNSPIPLLIVLSYFTVGIYSMSQVGPQLVDEATHNYELKQQRSNP